jgi:hypothetical protein
MATAQLSAMSQIDAKEQTRAGAPKVRVTGRHVQIPGWWSERSLNVSDIASVDERLFVWHEVEWLVFLGTIPFMWVLSVLAFLAALVTGRKHLVINMKSGKQHAFPFYSTERKQIIASIRQAIALQAAPQ